MKKEMIAMILAGDQGGRLGVLTRKLPKAAVSFGGKYRIIDFPLSNCINSGIDTVGVLTRYRPLRLNEHIGIGSPWDLDCRQGGVTILPPYERSMGNGWYAGNANMIYQNLEYIESCNPDYVLVLEGGDVYKMDYDIMLNCHKANNADVTVAVTQQPSKDPERCGFAYTDERNRITAWREQTGMEGFLSSMQICIFTWPVLKEILSQLFRVPGCSFDRHVIPLCLDKGLRVFAYEFTGCRRDVSTLDSYWEANMDLVQLIPEFNLYEEYWNVYTQSESIAPFYSGPDAMAGRCVLGEGAEIAGSVEHSVLGADVCVEPGAKVRDSIIMNGCHIGAGACIDKAILAENCEVGPGAVIGTGSFVKNRYDPQVYCSDLVAIGEGSVIPEGVSIGRNSAVMGVTVKEDYSEGALPGGGYLVKAGEGE